MPERLLRTAALLVATCAAFSPLAVRGVTGPHPATGARDALFGVVLLLLAALQSVRAEASPEELDSPPARRARRFAPLAVGLLLVGLAVFPYFEHPWRHGGGALLVLLFFVDLPLVAFWHVPSVRAVSLVVASVAALGAVVIVPDDAAAPCLLPVAAAWALIPALDRAAAVRGALEPRPRARLGPPLAAAAVVLAAGAGLFVATTLVTPASTRSWTPRAMLGPRARAAPPAPPPDLPVGKLLGLLLAAALTLAAWNAHASRAGRRRQVALVMPMEAGQARPLDPDEVARAVAAWPPGERRDVVEAYLGHVSAVDARARLREPGTTPAALARALRARLQAREAGAAADRLAERFGRARWDPAPVGPGEGAAAREEAREVEGGL
ncbi:MAG: hypothetical protein M9894_37070 [Planctomycetes bacterium]|nr:hypothetical protein [Planctomycetota bacterium]